jgi:hypothetical protein
MSGLVGNSPRKQTFGTLSRICEDNCVLYLRDRVSVPHPVCHRALMVCQKVSGVPAIFIRNCIFTHYSYKKAVSCLLRSELLITHTLVHRQFFSLNVCYIWF